MHDIYGSVPSTSGTAEPTHLRVRLGQHGAPSRGCDSTRRSALQSTSTEEIRATRSEPQRTAFSSETPLPHGQPPRIQTLAIRTPPHDLAVVNDSRSTDPAYRSAVVGTIGF